MRNTDWGFWAMMVMIILLLLSTIFLPACASLKEKPPKPVPPSSVEEMYKAARTSNWLVTLSILGIAGGIFATLNGQKWGMAVVVSCSVALFMSLAVSRFAFWLALCGLIGSVGLCIVSIVVRKRALVQIIKGGELFKKNPDIDFNHAQTVAQKSKSTRRIVQNIKTDLKLKGEIK